MHIDLCRPTSKTPISLDGNFCTICSSLSLTAAWRWQPLWRYWRWCPLCGVGVWLARASR